MDIELIDKAWACLPKEFKEEVKFLYKSEYVSDRGYQPTSTMVHLDSLFGHHNLTSDAEGEELLCVKASTVREMYALNEDILYSDSTHKGAILLKKKLTDLFGSKCLPDANEDNFTTKEPQPAEPKNDGTSQKQYVPQNAESGTHSFNHILKDDFRDHDRLHIAAMIAQGIMTNSNPQMVDMKVERMVDLAILTADTLIAKCEKGGDNA